MTAAMILALGVLVGQTPVVKEEAAKPRRRRRRAAAFRLIRRGRSWARGSGLTQRSGGWC